MLVGTSSAMSTPQTTAFMVASYIQLSCFDSDSLIASGSEQDLVNRRAETNVSVDKSKTPTQPNRLQETYT